MSRFTFQDLMKQVMPPVKYRKWRFGGLHPKEVKMYSEQVEKLREEKNRSA
tara:strand:+ start:492 stop:644 length:153 start_codon:yes stop_codon:yes gene_type:complete